MAGDAGFVEPQVRIIFFPDLGIFDEKLLMTFLAVVSGMGTFQLIAGEVMIKVVRIEPYHFELPAVVVAVAGEAFLP